MKRISWILLLAFGVAAPFVAMQTKRTTLDIYLVDVEGGNATLLVPPSGESILIDTGNGGANAARDAGRIMAAVTDAGIHRINHLITTHYHGDHFGGMQELAGRIPIANFIDHGPSVEANANTFLEGPYASLHQKAKRTIVKPGDRIAVSGLDVRVLTAAGQVAQTALPGAGSPNPYCAAFQPQAVDNGENAQSVGTHYSFGNFQALHLGDLTVNKEFDLMCPNNRIGNVELFVVSHHGQPSSNAAVLVHAIQPRVGIMNNGIRKGGQPDAMKILYSAPGLEDLWQIHFSQLSGQEYTVPGVFIANLFDEEQAAMPVAPFTTTPGQRGAPAPVHNGTAYWIKVAAQQDGTFTVTNSRNGFSKTYRAR
jgi:beta-lactamase superfamily II metal-dependent hydrolase